MAVAVALLAAVGSVALSDGASTAFDITHALLGFAYVTWASIGALVITKRAAPRVGWLLVAAGFFGATAALFETWAVRTSITTTEFTNSHLSLIVSGLLWTGWILSLSMFFLVVPTGTPPSARWRWLGLAVPAILANELIWLVSLAQSTTNVGDFVIANWNVGITDASTTVQRIGDVGTAALLATLGASVLSLVFRLRSATGSERQQVKWILYTGSVAAVALLFGLFSPAPVFAEVLVVGTGTVVFAAGLATALFRYRLYEIDRIINRTVVYAIVVVAIAVVYAVAALAVSSIPAGDDSLTVAVSTLAVAALFNPLRRRIQKAVDRRFYRSHYDAVSLVDEFVGSVRNEVDMEVIERRFAAIVNEAMKPASASIWVRADDRANT